MNALTPIRLLRKKVEKYRVTSTISRNAYEALLRLHERFPEKTGSEVIADAIRFAEAGGMYETTAQDLGIASRRKLEVSVGALPKKEGKQEWCVAFGGTIEQGSCRFIKYEDTVSGIVKTETVMPLSAMPNNEADLRKLMLGPFATVGEAEAAFAESGIKKEPLKERVLGGTK